MVKYYDALSSADLQNICECFDVTSKLISLYGVVNIASKEDIIKTYSGIIETWKTQNISNEIGYDKNTFVCFRYSGKYRLGENETHQF